MRRTIIFAVALIVLFAALILFNPWTAPSLDDVEPRIAAVPDGSAYYFADNRTDGAYIVETDAAGAIRGVHREAGDAAGRRAVIADILFWDGGVWFARSEGDVGASRADRLDICRVDAVTGETEIVFARVAVDASLPVRLSSDGESLYLTLRAEDGSGAFAYALPYSRKGEGDGAETIALISGPSLFLTAEAPEGVRILSAVTDGRYLHCSTSDGNVIAFSGGGSKSVFTDGLPMSLSSSDGGLFFADAALNAIRYEKEGASYRRDLPEEVSRVYAGAALEGMRFTVLVSTANGRDALIAYDGVDFGDPIRFAFNPVANARFSLPMALTPAGVAVLALFLFLCFFGVCILARTLFLRIIALQFCLVTLIVSIAVGTGYFVERNGSAGELPEDAAFLAALRAEEFAALADAALSSQFVPDAPAAQSAVLGAQLADTSETLLNARSEDFTVVSSPDLPYGLAAAKGFGPEVTALARAAAETGEPKSDFVGVRGRETLFAAAPVGASRVLLLSSDVSHVEYALARAFFALLRVCALPGFGALLLCVCLTARWLWPLLRLPKRMSDIVAKRVWDEDTRFAFGEIGRIQRAVQEICLSLSIREYEMSVAMNNYRRFMPQDLDVLLDRANLMEIEYGDVACGEADFGLLTTVLKGSKRFGANQRRFLDFVFAAFRAIYAAADGSAIFLRTGFSLTGFTLLFRNGSADGVRMGIRLATEAVETPEGVPKPDFLLVLHRTEYEYGVTGCEARAITFMSSYEVGLLTKVSPKLSTLGVKLIITERYGKNLADNVSTRYIGYITSSDERHSIKLYEVLDVYRESAKSLRKQYNEKFQEAIRLYYKNDFYLARNIFSEIFKNCPDDGVAKWYIFACERLFNRTDFSTINYSIFGAE
ncbi:MAG: hypothetical protein LBP73_06190 [Clostridiales Family XIII bacterium]|jgi:hypothetical protein|nr:hypothetical protein [Clostridiales Family XIII bacterium]